MTTREHPFTDPIANRECVLVIPPGGRAAVRHPECEVLADLCAEFDAFFCRACGWNGRVSGAWCEDMIRKGAGWR